MTWFDLFLDVVIVFAVALNLGSIFINRKMGKRQYAWGWIDGRMAMVESMGRAQRDGIPFQSWIAGEFLDDKDIIDGKIKK